MLTAAEMMAVLACLLVSVLNTTIGTTGGVTFAAMASVLPPTAVVPIHGLVESIASLFRWWLLRKFVDYRFLAFFTLGGCLGFAAGYPLIGRLSDDMLRTLLGGFILVVAWAPLGWIRVPPALAGAVTSFLSMLVGATGPLVAAIITHYESDHSRVIGTQGACTAIQHGVKAALFGLWGFSFAAYLPVIVALTLAIVGGTWAGRWVLLRAPQSVLKLLLKLIVTVLGVRLLLQGLIGF